MAKGDFRLRKTLWDRFHEKFVADPNSGCWIWTASTSEFGYGVIGLGHRNEGTDKAHKVSYRLYKGDIPAGLNVLHSCDVPECVNPKHLRLGTLSDNMQDCVKRKRNFTPDNRGEKASWSKLKLSDVEDIRSRRMPGTDFARLYKVSKSAIYQIWGGKNWQLQK